MKRKAQLSQLRVGVAQIRTAQRECGCRQHDNAQRNPGTEAPADHADDIADKKTTDIKCCGSGCGPSEVMGVQVECREQAQPEPIDRATFFHTSISEVHLERREEHEKRVGASFLGKPHRVGRDGAEHRCDHRHPQSEQSPRQQKLCPHRQRACERGRQAEHELVGS